MQKQLATITASLESAQTRLHRLADGLSDERWRARPAPDRWSVAECVEHLNMTSRAYLPLLRDALERARKIGGPMVRHYRRDFLGWLFSVMTGPLPHIGKRRVGRVKTSPAFVPKGVKGRAEGLAEFDRLQVEQIGLARSAHGLPLDKATIVSPFGGKIKYNAYSALVIIARHQHRHIAQAEDAAKQAAAR